MNRTSNQNKPKRGRWLLSGSLVACSQWAEMKSQLQTLVALVWVLLFSACGNPFNDERFEQKKWMAATTPEVRAHMAEDVIRNRVQFGMSTNAVVALLGEPTHIWTNKNCHPINGAMTYAYWLGTWPYHGGWDDTFVYVHFDAAGTVHKTEINGY